MKKLEWLNELNKASSIPEIFGGIPDRFFHQVLFYCLSFFCVSPLIMIFLLNIGIHFFTPYLVLLQMGYVSLVFSGLLFYKRWIEKKTKNKLRLESLCLWIVVFLAFLSTLFSSDPRLSFFGDYYRREGLLTMGAYVGILTGVVSIHDEKLQMNLIKVFSITGGFLGGVVILQSLGCPIESMVYRFGLTTEQGFIPWAGIYHNINHYGYFLVMGIMALSGLFIFEKRKIRGLIDLGILVLLSVVLVYNNTFGAYLGVCFSLFMTAGLFFYRKEKRGKILLLLLMFFGTTMIVNSFTHGMDKNITTLNKDIEKVMVKNEDSGRAGSGRWQLWIGAIEMMKEKPWLGLGLDNLRESYEAMGITMDRPHNEFLQIGASLGIPALLLYIAGLFIVFIKAVKSLSTLTKTKVIALMVFCGYLCSGLFGNTMYYTYPYFLIFLGMLFNRKTK